MMAALLAGLLATVAGGVRAADEESVTLTVRGMQTIEVPFAVVGYRMAESSIAKADPLGERKVLVTGIKEGATDLQVTGAGDAARQYHVTVVADIEAILKAVRKDIEDLSGVEASVSMGRVILRGHISKIEQWNYLQKVLALYGSSVVSLVEFRIPPEFVKSIRDSLERAGFAVVDPESPEANQPGKLSIQVNGQTIKILGKVYSRADIQSVQQILASMRWLTVPGAGAGKPEAGAKAGGDSVYGELALSVDNSMLEVGVAFIAISEKDFQVRRLNLLEGGLMIINDSSLAMRGGLGRNSSENRGRLEGQYSLGLGMNRVLQLWSGEDTQRENKVGHLSFKNDSDGSSFRDGGRLIVRVSGVAGGDVKEIPYGLELKVKGCLVGGDSVLLEIDTSTSIPEPIAGTGDYNLVEQRLEKVPILCKLGHSIVMAGSKQTLESVDEAGIPWLRRVPVVNWFVSEKAKESKEMRMLVILSPQHGPASTPSGPISDQTKGVLQDNQGRIEDPKKK